MLVLENLRWIHKLKPKFSKVATSAKQAKGVEGSRVVTIASKATVLEKICLGTT